MPDPTPKDTAVILGPTGQPITSMSPDPKPMTAQYVGASTNPVSEYQAKILLARPKNDELDITPMGEVYLPQVFYRKRLTEAFGPAGWALIPMGTGAIKGTTVLREFQLMVQGRFISQTAGEADYVPENARMSYATAMESAKSNALMRCCKDLGIASECWDKTFTDQFKKDQCVKVWVQGSKKPYWRKKTSPPFELWINGQRCVETGVVGEDAPLAKEPQRLPSQALSPQATALWKAIGAYTELEAERCDILEDVTAWSKNDQHFAGKRDIAKVSEKMAEIALATFTERYPTEIGG